MKIGILQTAYKKSEDYGAFYNVQELGLARALAKRGHDVTLYKAVDGVARSYDEKIEEHEQGNTGTTNDVTAGKLHIRLCSTKYIGINGLFDTKNLDKSLEILIYFSDTQISVSAIDKWCRKNEVKLIPYVGVIVSHSENSINRALMKYIAKRNVKIYKKHQVLAKTPAMVEKLRSLDCTNVKLFPVGLDETVMNSDEPRCEGIEAITINGYVDNESNVNNNPVHNLLFIGRMEEEKQPLEMVRIYDELLQVNPKISLTMIGDGHLYGETRDKLKEISAKYGVIFTEEVRVDSDETNDELGISDVKTTCTLLRKVTYDNMHSYYKNADVYINLNEVEILGMSILEAMYYGCLVVAIKAPGPDFILVVDSDLDGSVYNDSKDLCGMVAPDMEALEEVLKLLVNGEIEKDEIERLNMLAGNRVRNNFLWDSLVPKLEELMK